MLTATDQGTARFGALGKSLEVLLHSSVRMGMSAGWDVVRFRTNWKSVCGRRSGSNPIKDLRIAQLTQHAEEQNSSLPSADAGTPTRFPRRRVSCGLEWKDLRYPAIGIQPFNIRDGTC